MSKENSKPILGIGNILVLILAVITAALIFLWFKSGFSDEKKALEKDISDLKADISFYERAQENYTPSAVNKKINEDNINVNKSFRKKKSDIESSVTRVYDQTENMEDYENLEGDIEGGLGESFTEVLLEISEPKTSEAGEGQFPHEKLEDVKVAFSDYNIVDHKVRVFVLVDYDSPETGANNPGVDREDKQVTVGGQDLFILDYDLEDDRLTLDDYRANEQSEEASDD